MVSNSLSQKLENFFQVGQKVKIFNFIGFFFVKGRLVELETLSGVSCPDTEGLWKVWGKTESGLPIQPPKNLENFFRVGRKVKIFNFIGFFFLKGKLVESETFSGVSCPDTEGLWKVWGQTELWFPIQCLKNLKISFEWARRSKFLTLLVSFL